MKRLISVLLVFGVLAALAACGSRQAAEEKPEDDGSAEGYAGSADFDWSACSGAEIDIMWQDSDGTQRDIVQNYAMRYVAEATAPYGIRVNWIPNSGNTDYVTLSATGELGDIWFGSLSTTMVEAGIAMDLTPYLAVDSYLNCFAEPELLYFRDHIWALSTGVDGMYSGVLYYNLDLFRQLGIEEPETYEDFLYALEDCYLAGYGGLTFEGGPNSVYTRFLWQDTLISVDPLAAVAMIDGEEDAFSDPAMEGAIRQIRELSSLGYLGTGVHQRGYNDALQQFADGSCAMLYVNSWNNGQVLGLVSGAISVVQGDPVGVQQEQEEEEFLTENGGFEIARVSTLDGWCCVEAVKAKR